MHRLTCPHCSEPIDVPPAKAGGQVLCPHCDGQVAVPKLGELRRLPLAESESGDDSVMAPTPASGRSPLPFILLAVIATAALFVAGYCGLRYALMEVPETTESHLAKYKVEYQKVPPAQLIREYERMEEYGLELGDPLGYKLIADQKHQWGTTAASAAGIGFLATIGAVLTARRRN